MDLDEVAKTLGIKAKTLYQWRTSGRHGDLMPIHKGLNGRLFCLRDDVESFRGFYLFGQ